jgi:hypothetical protein
MPDGWYEFRVEVTDAQGNPEGEGRNHARISAPLLVDQTRPEVTAEVLDGVLRGQATDALSNIDRVEVSYDGEPTLLARAGDGIFDSLLEAFELKLPPHMLKGRHTLLIQVYDEAGNIGSARVVYGK